MSDYKFVIEEIEKYLNLSNNEIENELNEILEMIEFDNIADDNKRTYLIAITESVKKYGFDSVKERIKETNNIEDNDSDISVSVFDLNVYDDVDARYSKFIVDLTKTAEGIKMSPCVECGNPYHKLEAFQMRAADEAQSIRTTCTNATCGLVQMVQ